MNDESRTKQELIEELQELRVLLAKPEGGAPVHQGDGAAFQVLLEGAAGKTGESFFAAVVNALAAWLHVDCVILGTLDDHETLQAYTMFLDGRAVDGFSYPLAGSPCEKATHTGYCVFPEGVTAQFPDDRDLQELGAEGYVGIPLRDKQHHLIGILCAISRTRLTLPAKSREVFEIIAARAASELERKAAEEALQSSEERYREVVELSTEAIISCLDGKTSLWNRAAEQLFGYTSEEALGRDVAFIIPEQQREAHKAAWEKVRDTGVLKYGGKVILLEGLRKDGVIFPIEISISARQDSGKLCCTVIIRDITHRRRTEEALRNLAKVFSESVTPTVIEDMNGIICDANDAAVAVYGWSRDELIGSPIKKLVPADLQEEQGSALHERCRSGALVRDVEGVRIHKDGTPIPVLLTLSLLTDDKNNPTGIVTHATDITYRKKAEEARELLHSQLLQAQKVEAIGTLAGGVAHDFNNLLTAIMGNADLALMNINKEESLSRNLANIKDAGTRAAALTRQLLLYSRKQSLMITTFNINDVVQNILEMLRRLIGEDIAIDTDLHPDLCATRGDEGNIEQVIMNLAVNARDAMPNGGKLTIKSERVTIDDDYCRRYSYATPGRYIRMTIADTGTGMSEETQQRIFEPFFTTKGVGRGTGLGLAVVYGIIRKHEGWVNVESRVGRGTTFTVYLPAHLETVETVDEEAVSLEEYCGNGERILLVEDEAVVCEYGATALEENGYRVVVAGSAEEALASFIKERDNIDLLFTDVVLADYDGVQLVNELTSLRPDLKVLLSSGYTDEKSKWSVIEERGYSFLQKPYSIAALLKTVSDTLRR